MEYFCDFKQIDSTNSYRLDIFGITILISYRQIVCVIARNGKIFIEPSAYKRSKITTSHICKFLGISPKEFHNMVGNGTIERIELGSIIAESFKY